MENTKEYEVLCPQCDEVFVVDVLWNWCPVCASNLEILSPKMPVVRYRMQLESPAKTQSRAAARKFEEETYTVRKVSAMTGFSRQTVSRMFEKEPGVIVVKRPETLRKRSYRSIRIPRAVYERVVRRFSV